MNTCLAKTSWPRKMFGVNLVYVGVASQANGNKDGWAFEERCEKVE